MGTVRKRRDSATWTAESVAARSAEDLTKTVPAIAVWLGVAFTVMTCTVSGRLAWIAVSTSVSAGPEIGPVGPATATVTMPPAEETTACVTSLVPVTDDVVAL